MEDLPDSAMADESDHSTYLGDAHQIGQISLSFPLGSHRPIIPGASMMNDPLQYLWV
jgi:hypothetical protein